MPNPSDYDSQKKWMSACVPARKEEGDTQDQAVAVCLSIWRKHTGQPEPKGKAAPSLEQQQRRISTAWDVQRPRSNAPDTIEGGYVTETFDTYVIISANGAYWKVGYTDDDETVAFAPQDKWRKVEQRSRWVDAKNALKAISRTDDELRVGNYIVLFGGRDLEGVASPTINRDGSKGEFFTSETDLESEHTKGGVLFVDWEHGREDEPGPGDVLGVVDWKTARRDERGVWVERVLNRRSKYVKWMEELIDAGIIGSSTEAVPDEVQKADDGAIVRWPLRRDTLTVTPMEPRMMSENHIQAFKALGIPVPAQDDTANDSKPPEAEPEADKSAASAAGQGRMRALLLKNRLTMEGQ